MVVFAYDLNDFDASQLVEVIPQFHDTRNRYRQLEEAIREDRVGRVKEVQEEIAFIQNRKADCFLLYDLLDEGVLPLRVTHNDTKIKQHYVRQRNEKNRFALWTLIL